MKTHLILLSLLSLITTLSNCQTHIVDPIIKSYNNVKLDNNKIVNKELNANGFVVVGLLVKEAHMDTFWISRISFNDFKCNNDIDCQVYPNRETLMSCLKNHLDANLKIQPIEKTNKEETYQIMLRVTNQN
jgi:hypothetical protein